MTRVKSEVRSLQLAGHALSVAGCGAGQKHQSKFADLHLVAVRRHRRVHGFTVDVSVVEAADVAIWNSPLTHRNWACRRLTVMTSRKISLFG